MKLKAPSWQETSHQFRREKLWTVILIGFEITKRHERQTAHKRSRYIGHEPHFAAGHRHREIRNDTVG